MGMIDRDALLRSVKRANPVPDSESLPADLADCRPPLTSLIDVKSDAEMRISVRPESGGVPAATRRRGPLVAAAALLAVLIGAIPLVFLTTQEEEALVATTVVPATIPSVSTEPLTTTEAPSTTTTVQPLAQNLGMTWQRVEASAFEGGWIAAVAEGGPGFVAVGASRSGAAVWISADGTNWERVESDEFLGDEGRPLPLPPMTYMTDVVYGPSGFVAVGAADEKAAVWLSPNGLTWSRVPRDDVVFGSTESVMRHIVAASFGLVTVGEFEGRIASWGSLDGVTWTRSSLAGAQREDVFAVDPLGFQRTRMDLVAWNDLVIAVGSAHESGDGTFRPAVWISSDGAVWQMVPDDGSGIIEVEETDSGDPSVAAMVAVTADEAGLFALGWVGDTLSGGLKRPAVWSSVDGRNWELRPTVMYVDENQWGMAVIARSDGRLVASISDNRGGTMFASADDGDSWYPTASVRGGFGSEMFFNGDEIYWTVNDIIRYEDFFLAVGRSLTWSSTEDLGGDCYWDPGDGSAGRCRTDAAIWIGNWNG